MSLYPLASHSETMQGKQRSRGEEKLIIRVEGPREGKRKYITCTWCCEVNEPCSSLFSFAFWREKSRRIKGTVHEILRNRSIAASYWVFQFLDYLLKVQCTCSWLGYLGGLARVHRTLVQRIFRIQMLYNNVKQVPNITSSKWCTMSRGILDEMKRNFKQTGLLLFS